jgi:peroxiredoxin-like protein
MSEAHKFTLRSVWTGNGDGDGTLTTEWGDTRDYGRPEEMGGKPGRSNPEEMLICSVAACYSITLALLAERRRLPLTQIHVTAEGEVVRQPDQTLKFTRIDLYPELTLANEDEKQIATAIDAAHKAEVYCVISRALRGNVEITVSPQIVHA